MATSTSTIVGYCWVCRGQQTIKVTTTTAQGAIYQQRRTRVEVCDHCGTQLASTSSTVDVRSPAAT